MATVLIPDRVPSSLQIPRVKAFGISSFLYTGIKAWNELPNNIQGTESKFQFKKQVKQFLFTSFIQREHSSVLYY